jgi:molybdate transport system substrate-binding protein
MNRSIVAVLAALALAAVGCGPDTGFDPAAAPPREGGWVDSVAGTVTVFAAASLTESFTTLAARFEAAHPGVQVKLNFGASSALALQIVQGAPADVFASASATNMTQVIEAKAAAGSTTFARNELEIAVPPANPAGIASIADLARPGVKVALCQRQVPCGASAVKVFDNAGLTVEPVTLEPDVKAALTKVELGEVDAAVVYLTDVRAAGARVKGIAIPDAQNAATDYPIALLAQARDHDAGWAFVDFVLSAAGRDVLSATGFAAP